MKINSRSSISYVLTVLLLWNSEPILAASEIAVIEKPTPPIASPAGRRLSDRVVVKFKPSVMFQGESAEQINVRLSQPLAAGVVAQMQAAANTEVSELHATGSGAHVMSVAAQPDRRSLDKVIAGLRSLPNVEYAEEDIIMTEQAVPNDTYYLTFTSSLGTTYPGLWGMWPVSPVAALAPGQTGSYGADFQTAWNTTTGAGVVVAVVDTGITPSWDIVGDVLGQSGVVAAGSGGNLVSVGYDFISDCRIRGSCAASTPTASASVAPSPNATDLGNFVSVQDNIDNPTLFPVPKLPATLPTNSTWHGTHVAGTIAAIGNNSRGVIGGAYGAKILPVRVLGKGGGYVSDISSGMLWAAGRHPSIANPNPAKVINVSLGANTSSCPTEMQDAINTVVSAGAVVVAAAGNLTADVANNAPANCQNVISVAAVGRDGSRAKYSNFSSPASNTTNPINVTLAAPGGDFDRADFNPGFDPGILSTFNLGTTTMGASGYGIKEGTSMATPHVSAAVALMFAKNSTLSPAQVKSILSSTASVTAFPSFAAGSYPALNGMDCTVSQNCGAGILNANLALRNTPPGVVTPSSGGGGGGCSIMPFGTAPDVSLLLAMLAVAAYWLRRKMIRTRGEA